MAEPNHVPFTHDCPCRECKGYRDRKRAQEDQERLHAQEGGTHLRGKLDKYRPRQGRSVSTLAYARHSTMFGKEVSKRPVTSTFQGFNSMHLDLLLVLLFNVNNRIHCCSC